MEPRMGEVKRQLDLLIEGPGEKWDEKKKKYVKEKGINTLSKPVLLKIRRMLFECTIAEAHQEVDKRLSYLNSLGKATKRLARV